MVCCAASINQFTDYGIHVKLDLDFSLIEKMFFLMYNDQLQLPSL